MQNLDVRQPDLTGTDLGKSRDRNPFLQFFKPVEDDVYQQNLYTSQADIKFVVEPEGMT